MGGDSGKRGDPGMEKQPRSRVRTQSRGGGPAMVGALGAPTYPGDHLRARCEPRVKDRGLWILSPFSGGKEAAAEPTPECQ